MCGHSPPLEPGAGLSGAQDSTQCTSLAPWQSPRVGVLVVTAVVQELHHGLLGERGWRSMGLRLQEEAHNLHPTGLRGLTLEVLARSCCSSWGDVTMGMRHSGDRFSLFCWRRSGRWLTAQPKVTHSPLQSFQKLLAAFGKKSRLNCPQGSTASDISDFVPTHLPCLLGFSPTNGLLCSMSSVSPPSPLLFPLPETVCTQLSA